MPALNWGVIHDGGTLESLMHAILYAKDQGIILFGRPGKDAGQDARTADGSTVFQAKYRQHLNMDGAVLHHLRASQMGAGSHRLQHAGAGLAGPRSPGAGAEGGKAGARGVDLTANECQ
jgi:hypothetical protein